ncbi:MAG TPA: hypothetical protein VF717_06570 [Pyrinomonadaceae bacterium]|jgi:uncharacterized Zn finger protein (UPF0148 family)
MNRKQPFKAVGVLAAILISPRDFLYTNCEKCEVTLYYTYVGEECPFCGTIITDFQQGRLPKAEVTTTSNGNGHKRRRHSRRQHFSRAASPKGEAGATAARPGTTRREHRGAAIYREEGQTDGT